MGSEENVVPITRGRQKPNLGSFAVIAGKTRVDVSIDPGRPARREPAKVIELASLERHGAKPLPPRGKASRNNPLESK